MQCNAMYMCTVVIFSSQMTRVEAALAANKSVKELRDWAVIGCATLLCVFILTTTLCAVYQTYSASYYGKHVAKSLHKIAKTTALNRKERCFPSHNASNENHEGLGWNNARNSIYDPPANSSVPKPAGGFSAAAAANSTSTSRLPHWGRGGEGAGTLPPFVQSRRKRSLPVLRKHLRQNRTGREDEE